jgi:hypothetical protein
MAPVKKDLEDTRRRPTKGGAHLSLRQVSRPHLGPLVSRLHTSVLHRHLDLQPPHMRIFPHEIFNSLILYVLKHFERVVVDAYVYHKYYISR